MNLKVILAYLILLAFSLNSAFPLASIVATSPLNLISVPEDFLTIQSAINNATSGDTILIANGTYNEHLTINKPITLIGAGNNLTVLNGTIADTAIKITAGNVTIKGFTIQRFYTGIVINQSRNIYIAENQITKTWTKGAIYLINSKNTTLTRNTVTKNQSPGIHVLNSNTTKFFKNNITNNDGIGISLNNCINSTAIGNHIESNLGDGIFGAYTYNLHIQENTLALNDYRGVWASNSNGTIFHNNFVRNRENARTVLSSFTWDDDYPSGGNYWSNYTGEDLYIGPSQNESSSDGIGDIPLMINAASQDRYPLMKTYPWGPHDLGITTLTISKTVIYEGHSGLIKLIVFNYGSDAKSFITIYANTTVIATFTINILPSRNSAILILGWNTTGWTYGNYTIGAEITPVQNETDTTDNTRITGTVAVTVQGDCNLDGIVNIKDAALIGLYWLQTVPPAPVNLDFNGDGVISKEDATLIGVNWQKHA